MDINHFFTEEGLRAWTEDRRDQHLEDARHYGQLADILVRRMRQSPVDGDRPWDKALRARRIVRPLRDMERVSRRAAADAEALYTTYATGFLELPARRERAAIARKAKADSRAQRRALRRAKVAQLEQPHSGGLPPQPPADSGRSAGAGITDLFKREAS